MGDQSMRMVGVLSADLIMHHVFRILSDENSRPTNSMQASIDPKWTFQHRPAFFIICLISGVIVMLCCCTGRCSRASEPQIAARQAQREAAAAPVMPSQGLDKSTVGSLPLVGYSRVKGLKGGKDPSRCTVCLTGFEEHENVRLLPTCGHVFHPDCIDMWFHSHTTCPLCRTSVVPSDSPSEQFQNWITSRGMALDGEASTIHAGPPVPPNASILELLPREGAPRILA